MIKAALFCDETKEYRCPEEPDAGDEVRLRFRTAADDVERVVLVLPDENRQIMVKLNLRRIFFTDNHLWFMKSYNDTLFRITPKRTIEPYLILHRGKHAPMLNDKSDRIPIDILHYKEVGPYSFIAYSRLQIWNHETGRLVASRKIEKYTLLNSLGNFNYRLPDNRIIQINLMSVCNEKLIFITSPSVDDTLRDYLNLREDDNPVIMVAQLKK